MRIQTQVEKLGWCVSGNKYEVHIKNHGGLRLMIIDKTESHIVWTTEEDAFLAEQALKCKGLYQLKLLLNAKYPNNRSTKAVQIRVAYLRSIGAIGDQTDKNIIHFSPEQDQWLMDNRKKLTYEKMAEHLNSTAGIVGKRVRQLKFERGVE